MSDLGPGVLSELEVNVKDKSIHFLDETDIRQIHYNGDVDKNEQELKDDYVKDAQQLEQNNGFVLKEPLNSENLQDENYDQTTQENTTSFKEIAEHVISINIESQDKLKTNSSNTSLNPETNCETETHLEQSTEDIVPTTTEVQREETQESGSPCQSDCSRATRWEALADMAAELPPSVTIDPITGHIYAVGK